MARYRTTVSSKWDVATAFRYMSDFSNSAIWDPGVASARTVSAGDIGLGTKFDLVTTFNGRSLPLNYEITAFDPPRRVVLRAQSATVISIDEVTFSATATGTDVTYDALLKTRGAFRLAAPIIALMFKGIGDRAKAGLQRELNV